MVQSRITTDGEQAVDCACFGVGSSVNEARDPRRNESARAHGARLERHVERRALQSPVPEFSCRFAQREGFRVGDRILELFAAVVVTRELAAVRRNHDAPDGDVTVFGRQVGLRERDAHPIFVTRSHAAPAILPLARWNQNKPRTPLFR
jgi:hypothetical protein